jgi:isoleucyl-tRNA synthetase
MFIYWHASHFFFFWQVMPYSTGCTTPLSNFESSQNYKDVNDPASKFCIL